MATTFAAPRGADRERRFHFILALIMAAIVVAGFSMNLAMGRSTFAVPWQFHAHAVIFFAWVVLYIVQAGLISANNAALHRRLGVLAYVLVPLMVVMAFVIIVKVLQRTGGPFFFAQNEFLCSNLMMTVLFAVLAFAALRVRRHNGWHRRLLLCAFTILVGPGLGRLLPMPLLIPNAWVISELLLLVFPLSAAIYDWRRRGKVHPALWWGMGSYVTVLAISIALSWTAFGIGLTERVVAGTPGAERPMEAFLPPGFAM
ncbi:MAG TPA: hypothetical protein VHN58_02125 [Croceicoccus sp.]|nr:hypothetical protein [Croceicoccus sp.]